jgi:hypothetical protein
LLKKKTPGASGRRKFSAFQIDHLRERRLSSTELPNKGLLIVNFLPWAMVLLLSADLLDVEEAFPDIRKVNASLRANDGPFDNRQGVLEGELAQTCWTWPPSWTFSTR